MLGEFEVGCDGGDLEGWGEGAEAFLGRGVEGEGRGGCLGFVGFGGCCWGKEGGAGM